MPGIWDKCFLHKKSWIIQRFANLGAHKRAGNAKNFNRFLDWLP